MMRRKTIGTDDDGTGGDGKENVWSHYDHVTQLGQQDSGLRPGTQRPISHHGTTPEPNGSHLTQDPRSGAERWPHQEPRIPKKHGSPHQALHHHGSHPDPVSAAPHADEDSKMARPRRGQQDPEPRDHDQREEPTECPTAQYGPGHQGQGPSCWPYGKRPKPERNRPTDHKAEAPPKKQEGRPDTGDRRWPSPAAPP